MDISDRVHCPELRRKIAEGTPPKCGAIRRHGAYLGGHRRGSRSTGGRVIRHSESLRIERPPIHRVRRERHLRPTPARCRPAEDRRDHPFPIAAPACRNARRQRALREKNTASGVPISWSHYYETARAVAPACSRSAQAGRSRRHRWRRTTPGMVLRRSSASR